MSRSIDTPRAPLGAAVAVAGSAFRGAAPRRRRVYLTVAILGALVAAALAVAASRAGVLLVDLPEQRATLLVKRSAIPGLRFLDSTDAVCRRQRPGSPLHSIYLGPAFCEHALLVEGMAAGENVYLRLPFSKTLKSWSGEGK